MAYIDTTSTALTHEVFALAGRIATTSTERQTLETELKLEMIYQIRMSRRRTHDCSRYDSPAVKELVGWN